MALGSRLGPFEPVFLRDFYVAIIQGVGQMATGATGFSRYGFASVNHDHLESTQDQLVGNRNARDARSHHADICFQVLGEFGETGPIRVWVGVDPDRILLARGVLRVVGRSRRDGGHGGALDEGAHDPGDGRQQREG